MQRILEIWKVLIAGSNIAAQPLYNLVKRNAVQEWTPQHRPRTASTSSGTSQLVNVGLLKP